MIGIPVVLIVPIAVVYFGSFLLDDTPQIAEDKSEIINDSDDLNNSFDNSNRNSFDVDRDLNSTNN